MAIIRLFLLAMLLTIVTQVSSLPAGKYNSTLSPGDAAPAWKSLPAVDGKNYSLTDFESSKVIVVVFTCNSCPYAVDIEDRLLAFHQKYGKQGVALVAINVNKVEADLMPAMKDKAKEKAFQFPYLFDETQKIAKDYGAKRTPEFFVLDQDRKVVYMGALDDSPEGKKVSKRYIEAAVEMTLAGEKIEIAETIPVGCAVRFERTRRTRRVRKQ
jgi:peroxiredoxin